MKITLLYICGLITSLLFTTNISAKNLEGPYRTVDSLNKKYLNWHNYDIKNDKITGISLYKAYTEILANKTPKKKVIVAVIDSGIDINHEDLKGKIWTNKKEIPGNGIDDDNNGYIDDVNGWNFLGNKTGENEKFANLEYVRIYKRFYLEFNKYNIENDVPADRKADYQIFKECKLKYNEELKSFTEQKKVIVTIQLNLDVCMEILQKATNKEKPSLQDIINIKSTDETINKAKEYYLRLNSEGVSEKYMKDWTNYVNENLDHYLNINEDPRKIVGDDPYNIKDNKYGNNDVIGPEANHGTFVAGLIAANRNNGIGIDGINDNVEIMVIRAVPNGDESDKDVALAIRYAVDNGANIINMSFGKAYSPLKSEVDAAVKYAEEKNVLLIDAAGNESENNDIKPSYPNRYLLDKTEAKNWITVGASSIEKGKKMVGYFSNYGTKTVDIFAPGVDIISLEPGSKYVMENGTSFSSPIVAGVAALVLSYYPDLTAVQLKEILLNSATKLPKQKVNLPSKSDKKEKVRFGTLSKTGGIINAYEALKLAETVSKQNK